MSFLNSGYSPTGIASFKFVGSWGTSAALAFVKLPGAIELDFSFLAYGSLGGPSLWPGSS